MAVGVMLLVFWLVASVGCSAMTVGGRDLSSLARLGFGAGAVSSYLLVWWCCRFWYVAFSEGRRAEPVAEPGMWLWGLPTALFGVVLGCIGVGEVMDGHGGGWILIGMGVLLGGLSVLLLGVEVYEWMRPTPPTPAPVRPAEPPRPQRNWGSIGR